MNDLVFEVNLHSAALGRSGPVRRPGSATMRRTWLAMVLAILAFGGAAQAAPIPRPAHVVVVIEENKAFSQIIGNEAAPYINRLAAAGALMEQSYAVTHPSLPNYLALFSGSTHGIRDDACRHELNGDNLAAALIKAGLGFAIFSEGLPKTGSRVCLEGEYRKKHNPAAYFGALPGGINRPLRDFPPDFSRLPAVTFVVPNLEHDMHDGSIARGDAWLKSHLDAYVRWARSHDSLLVLTFDEDDTRNGNHIVTLFAGAGVHPGRYSRRIDHYDVLATLAAFYGVPAPGEASQRKPISGIWSH